MTINLLKKTEENNGQWVAFKPKNESIDLDIAVYSACVNLFPELLGKNKDDEVDDMRRYRIIQHTSQWMPECDWTAIYFFYTQLSEKEIESGKLDSEEYVRDNSFLAVRVALGE